MEEGTSAPPVSRRLLPRIGSIPLAVVGCLLGGTILNSAEDLQLHGTRVVSLRVVAQSFGMKRTWLKANERMALSSTWTRMEFRANRRDFLLNGTKVYLGHSVALSRGDLHIGRIDFERTLKPILTPRAFPDVPKLFRIVIDPGHGGKDPGSTNKTLKLQEKALSLDISKRLRAILRNRGYEVLLTREDDTYTSLVERPALANRSRADLFISVHLNAVESRSVRGTETYALTLQNQPSTVSSTLRSSDRIDHPGNRMDCWNTLLAYYVHRDLVRSLKTRDRGVKRGRMAVLKPLHCPGILVEAGFVTNREEARKLRTASYRQEIAQGIADGVFRYQKTLNRLRGLSKRLDEAPRKAGEKPLSVAMRP